MSEPRHISEIIPEAIARIAWKSITAKRHSIGSCGHMILAGDAIGFDPESKKTRCCVCFSNIRAREAREKHRRVNEKMKVG